MSSPDPKNTNPKIEQAGASDQSIQNAHSNLLHNKPEPKEGSSPTPLLLLGFISALILGVAIYIVHNSGGFDPMVYDERFDPRTAKNKTEAVQIDPVAQGKKLYASVCQACHQPTGGGIPGVYPPLAHSEWVNGSEERVIRILLHGLQGPIKVAGGEFNSVMPAVGPGSGYNLDDNKIAYVLTYIRQEWGNSAPAVEPSKVAQVRSAVASRSTPWTASELEAVP